MQIKELSTPVNSKALNENLSQKFGYSVNTEKFSLEQLHTAKHRLESKLQDLQLESSFDSVLGDHQYQKNRLMLDVINQAIVEKSENVSEKAASKAQQKFMGMVYAAKKGEKPASPDVAKAAKGMSKKAAHDFAATKHKGKPEHVGESLVMEGEEDKAALIIAAKDMVDKLTSWLEDTASMQSEGLLQIGDGVRDEMGSDVSDSFVNTVKPALEAIYNSLESNREVIANSLSILTGEGEAPMLGTEEPADEVPATTEVPAEEPATDEFAASAPATGGTEATGRAKRESVERSRKLAQILTSNSKKK